MRETATERPCLICDRATKYVLGFSPLCPVCKDIMTERIEALSRETERAIWGDRR